MALTCPDGFFDRDLGGKVFLITGATSGVGKACAAKLVSLGGTVVVANRSGGAALVEELSKGAAKGGTVANLELDLASLASVRAFAATFKETYSTLDVLMNNAAVMMPPCSKTVDGFELQMGTNHYGHFLLTLLLKDVLEKTPGSRVVCVASAAACKCTMMCPSDPKIDYDDINWEVKKYEKDLAYGQSKLANVLMAREIPKRFDGVKAYSLHPGWVQSKLMRHAIPFAFLQRVADFVFMNLLGSTGMIDVDAGSQTSLYCALADDLEGGAFSASTIRKAAGRWRFRTRTTRRRRPRGCGTTA